MTDQHNGARPHSRAPWVRGPCTACLVLIVISAAGASWGRLDMRGELTSGKLTLMRMSLLSKVVEIYASDNSGELPTSLLVLTEPDLKSGASYIGEIECDAWGNALRYASTGPRTFVIFSNGPDGQPDTEDDIRYPELD